MTNRTLAYLVAGLVGLSLLIGRPTAVAPDSAEYVAYMVSALQDGNLYFGDEFEVWQVPRFWNHPVPDNPDYVANSIPVGPSLFWLPFYASGLVAGGDPDVLAMSMMVWIHLATQVYAALLSWVVLRYIIRKLGSGHWITLTAIVTGTPLLYYLAYESVNSHVLSGLFIALFIDLWDQRRMNGGVRWWFLLGLTGAFAGLVRWQELVVLAIPAWDLVKRPGRVTRVIYYGSGVMVGIIPQLAVWYRLYGSPFLKPQQQAIFWLSPDFAATLWSSHHGLLVWTPLYILTTLGLLFYCWKRPADGLPLLGFFLVQIYINSAFNPHGGRSFGIRRLTDCTLIMGLGYAHLLMLVRAQKSLFLKGLTASLSLAAVLWTLALTVAFRFNLIQGELYVTYGEVIGAVRQVVTGPLLLGRGLIREGLIAIEGGAVAIPLLLVVALILAFIALPELIGTKLQRYHPIHWFLPVYLVSTIIILRAALFPRPPVGDWTAKHRETVELIQALGQKAAQNPGDAHAQQALEHAYFRIGNYQRSLELMDKRLSSSPAQTADLIGRAICLMYLDRFDEAERQLEEVLQRNPDEVEATYNLGLLKYQRGKIEEAKALLLELWEAGVREPKLAEQLARCYERLNYHHLQHYFHNYVQQVRTIP